MSGGSYNYLTYADADELLNKHGEDLSEMADALAARGHEDAARETNALKADALAYRARTEASIKRLEGVWKAVEWVDSCDWGEESIGEALAKYRGQEKNGYNLTGKEVDRIKAEAWDQGAREGDLAQYSGRAARPNPYRDTPENHRT